MKPVADGSAGATARLVLSDIDKAFGGVRALRGACMEVTAPGVGHALVGANGSGKSTLLAILSGQMRPDTGSMHLDGRAVSLSSPVAALRHGIAMVAQETAVAPDLTVAENVFLGGRMRRSRLGIDWPATSVAAATAMRALGVEMDVERPVRDLRPDEQQIVEIARALSMDCSLLILDEPTSSLTEDEVESVSAAIRRAKALGVAVVLVSHRFDEVLGLCEEATVLRDGRTVAQGPLSDHDADSLVELMVGRRLHSVAPAPSAVGASTGPVALQLRRAGSDRAFADVNLSVHAGEIVGIAGLVGSGRSELLEAVFGGRPMSGEVLVDGEPLTARSPRRLIDRGIGYVPPDRKRQGIVLSQSVADNLSMVASRAAPRWRTPPRHARRKLADSLGGQLGLRTDSPDTRVEALSGGNQQKVALGKWLAADAKVLLLDEPTRGVDVEAKAEIHSLLRAAAGRGIALLVSSSETSELMGLCSRIVVMARGRVVADLPVDGLSEDVLAHHSAGEL